MCLTQSPSSRNPPLSVTSDGLAPVPSICRWQSWLSHLMSGSSGSSPAMVTRLTTSPQETMRSYSTMPPSYSSAHGGSQLGFSR
ncbi:MAG: hypothetical protein CMH84_04295 [Nocardioides sp.]|nr:hypothetical protein [Nocardioides sp.]